MDLMRILSLSMLAALLFSSMSSSLSPKAEKFDFQVVSISEYHFRTVRVFWNPHRNLVMMKIFEKNQAIALESLHYATKLDVTISLNAHSFHIYSLEDFLLRTNATAIIEVPAQSEILSIPAYVITMTDQGFEYQWVKPNINGAITNISLIWCDHMGANLQTCGESIRGYTELEAEATKVRLNHEESIDMALRIDTSSSSSGIVLPKCKIHQSEVGILNDRPKLKGSSSHISIEWPMKCPQEGIIHGVTGYNLYYCRLQNGTFCNESETKLSFKTHDMVLEAEIDGLTPSTRYQIAGTVVFGNGTESGRRELIYTTMPAPYLNTTRHPWILPRTPRKPRWIGGLSMHPN